MRDLRVAALCLWLRAARAPTRRGRAARSTEAHEAWPTNWFKGRQGCVQGAKGHCGATCSGPGGVLPIAIAVLLMVKGGLQRTSTKQRQGSC